MSEYKQSLFPIGNLAKTCGVTRRMLLNYEAHGLLEPVEVHADSGFRYYGATSVARVCAITRLQKTGLSLNDIGRYFSGEESAMRTHLDELYLMRERIAAQISVTEASLTPKGDWQIRLTSLPAFDAYTETAVCTSSSERYVFLWKLCSRVFEKGWRVSDSPMRMTVFVVPDDDGVWRGRITGSMMLAEANEETVNIPATAALYLNMRGPYTQLSAAFAALRDYAAANGFEPGGNIRIMFLNNAQTHGDPEKYVAQIFLPVMEGK